MSLSNQPQPFMQQQQQFPCQQHHRIQLQLSHEGLRLSSVEYEKPRKSMGYLDGNFHPLSSGKWNYNKSFIYDMSELFDALNEIDVDVNFAKTANGNPQSQVEVVCDTKDEDSCLWKCDENSFSREMQSKENFLKSLSSSSSNEKFSSSSSIESEHGDGIWNEISSLNLFVVLKFKSAKCNFKPTVKMKDKSADLLGAFIAKLTSLTGLWKIAAKLEYPIIFAGSFLSFKIIFK